MRLSEYRRTVYFNDYRAIVVDEEKQTYFITANQLDKEKVQNMVGHFIFEAKLEPIHERLIKEQFLEDRQVLKG